MSTSVNSQLQQLNNLLVRIESQARAATNIKELGFSIANDSYGLLGFRQAIVAQTEGGRAKVMCVSGLVTPTEDSPYLVWLRQAIPYIEQYLKEAKGQWLQLDELVAVLPESAQEGWQEWWTNGLYVLPITSRKNQRLGLVFFLLEKAPQAWQLQSLERVAQTWSYCWEVLKTEAAKPVLQGLRRWLATKKMLVLAICIAVLLIPVRLTALASAEVISLDAQVIAAPLDGVIKSIQVRPNQLVEAGQRLFSFDDTTLTNRLAIARQSVAVADAEYIAATQKAFQDSTSQSELTLLSARAHEKRAELSAIQTQLRRIDVIAPTAGVAVYADPDEWLGKPVSTGERIMLLANESDLGALVHVSVADAIALDVGAPVTLFLKANPLKPLSARIIESSYQAVVSPEGIASYRIRVAFDDEDRAKQAARIGLQGTAKVYGDRVVLIYYLMRRPLASLRAWTGW